MSSVKALTEKQKREQGLEFNAQGKELRRERLWAKSLCHEFNSLPPEAMSKRNQLLYRLFKVADNAWIEPPFYCDYGYNISLGKNFYANHGLVILDAASVTFGNDVLLGPGVNIATSSHPLTQERRRQGLETAKPIVLGDGVWVGMGAQILPGVTIGDGAVVAAGAVVNKDVAADTLVAGVPAKVIRKIV